MDTHHRDAPALPPAEPNELMLLARAKIASADDLKVLLQNPTDSLILAVLDNRNLNELDLVAALRKNRYQPETLTQVASHPTFKRSYRIKLALCLNPKTPHRLVLPFLRELFLFDQLAVIQHPFVSPDIKVVAEHAILEKLKDLPLGNKITLARRASANLLDRLIETDNITILQACLDNPRLRELSILKAIHLRIKKPWMLDLIFQHYRWGSSYDVRLALLQHPDLPASAREKIVTTITRKDLLALLAEQRVDRKILELCEQELSGRGSL
jgi:hypothetical protein